MTLSANTRGPLAQLVAKRADHSAGQDGVMLYDREGKHPVVSVDGSFRTLATLVSVPATATSPGQPGDYAVNATHRYDCIATDTWVRSAVATF